MNKKRETSIPEPEFDHMYTDLISNPKFRRFLEEEYDKESASRFFKSSQPQKVQMLEKMQKIPAFMNFYKKEYSSQINSEPMTYKEKANPNESDRSEGSTETAHYKVEARHGIYKRPDKNTSSEETEIQRLKALLDAQKAEIADLRNLVTDKDNRIKQTSEKMFGFENKSTGPIEEELFTKNRFENRFTDKLTNQNGHKDPKNNTKTPSNLGKRANPVGKEETEETEDSLSKLNAPKSGQPLPPSFNTDKQPNFFENLQTTHSFIAERVNQNNKQYGDFFSNRPPLFSESNLNNGEGIRPKVPNDMNSITMNSFTPKLPTSRVIDFATASVATFANTTDIKELPTKVLVTTSEYMVSLDKALTYPLMKIEDLTEVPSWTIAFRPLAGWFRGTFQNGKKLESCYNLILKRLNRNKQLEEYGRYMFTLDSFSEYETQTMSTLLYEAHEMLAFKCFIQSKKTLCITEINVIESPQKYKDILTKNKQSN